MVSDIVLESPLPQEIRDDMEAYVGCIAGASLKQDYLKYRRKTRKKCRGYNSVCL